MAEAVDNPVADPNNAPSDAGPQPGADDPNVDNSDASPPETDQGTSNSDAQPNSDTRVSNSDTGTPNSDGTGLNSDPKAVADPSVTNSDAGAPNSETRVPNSDTGAPNGGNSTDTEGPAPNSDTAPENINTSDTGDTSTGDKGGDKINTLNNIGDSVGPTNSSDTGASDQKIPEKDPNRINLLESATNQSTTQQPVLLDITTEGKPEILPVETTATEIPTTETSTLPSTTTAKATTDPIIIEFPNSAKTDPPYAIVTSSSPTNGTLIGPGDKGGSKGAVVIAGSIIGVLILVVLVVILIIWFLRRKKRRAKQPITMVENPRYKDIEPTVTRSSPAPPAPHNYRFSRDADIAIGEVRTGKLSNNNLKVSPMFGKKGMLSYSPSGSGSDLSTGTGSRKKRRAPPPPNPFGNPDYYERDSNGSDDYEMTTFGTSTFGKGVAPSPKQKQNAPDEPAKEPLLNGNASKEPKRSGDYSSSSSSSDEEEENGEIQKAVEDKFNEHRNSDVYTGVDDEEEEEDYDQSLNPFSDSFKARSKKE